MLVMTKLTYITPKLKRLLYTIKPNPFDRTWCHPRSFLCNVAMLTNRKLSLVALVYISNMIGDRQPFGDD